MYGTLGWCVLMETCKCMHVFTLTVYGGLYLDWDEVILQSVDKFRDYDVTMVREYFVCVLNTLLAFRNTFLRS